MLAQRQRSEAGGLGIGENLADGSADGKIERIIGKVRQQLDHALQREKPSQIRQPNAEGDAAFCKAQVRRCLLDPHAGAGRLPNKRADLTARDDFDHILLLAPQRSQEGRMAIDPIKCIRDRLGRWYRHDRFPTARSTMTKAMQPGKGLYVEGIWNLTITRRKL